MPSDRPGGADDDTPGPIRSEPGSLLEHVSVAVFAMDDEERIRYWGPGARNLFGHTAEEVLSRPASVLFPDPAPGAPAGPRSWWSAGGASATGGSACPPGTAKPGSSTAASGCSR